MADQKSEEEGMVSTKAEELLNVTRHILEEAEFCFLITRGESEALNARLMQPFGPDDDLTIWFGASPRSRKIREIRQDNRVTVTFEYAEEAAYATLLGEAAIKNNIEIRRRYWRESFSAFWPEGPGDDDYILIRFSPYRIEVMDIDLGVAPEPFGLQPAILERHDSDWTVLTG